MFSIIKKKLSKKDGLCFLTEDQNSQTSKFKVKIN